MFLPVITQFDSLENVNLWETVSILKRGSFQVHDAVKKVILMGSRGVLGGFTETSDIDIGLVTSVSANCSDEYLHEILDVTLNHWNSSVSLDLKLLFDSNQCQMKCIQVERMVYDLCEHGNRCVGAFDKSTGRQASERYSTEALYPIITIWEQESNAYQKIPLQRFSSL